MAGREGAIHVVEIVHADADLPQVIGALRPAGRFSGDLQSLGIRIDASGGWWDAGDYIKGVQTLGYTTAMMLHGVREFPSAMGAGYNADQVKALADRVFQLPTEREVKILADTTSAQTAIDDFLRRNASKRVRW